MYHRTGASFGLESFLKGPVDTAPNNVRANEMPAEKAGALSGTVAVQ